MNAKAIADQIVQDFLVAFWASDYPKRSVEFFTEHSEIVVRMPPKRLSGMHCYSQFPAIARIWRHERIQGHNILERIVQGMLSQPPVVGVCISQISNERLERSLRDKGWSKLLGTGEFHPTFYTVNDQRYRALVAAGGSDAFDERESNEVELKLAGIDLSLYFQENIH